MGSNPVIDVYRRYCMKIGKLTGITFIIILMLSAVYVAVENTENVNITINEYKSEDIDKNLSQEMVVVVIHTNQTGYLNYLEKYYSKNNTGVLKLDSAAMYYNGTMTNDTLTLKIKRPLNIYGESYPFVKAVVYIDNNKKLDSWFLADKDVKPSETKDSPGFDVIIPVISIILTTFLLKRKKIKI